MQTFKLPSLMLMVNGLMVTVDGWRWCLIKLCVRRWVPWKVIGLEEVASKRPKMELSWHSKEIPRVDEECVLCVSLLSGSPFNHLLLTSVFTRCQHQRDCTILDCEPPNWKLKYTFLPKTILSSISVVLTESWLIHCPSHHGQSHTDLVTRPRQANQDKHPSASTVGFQTSLWSKVD